MHASFREEVRRLGGLPRRVRSCLREQLKDASSRLDVSEGFTFIRDA
jgi:hypothetical protein